MATVEAHDIRDLGLVGTLFAADDRPCPGILVLGGSDGGRPGHLAQLLASEGFCCLALSYFGAPGLPKQLVEIPLGYLETALGWLVEHRGVRGSGVGVLGFSKGAELALLAAATYPRRIRAVVAYAPSSVVFAGVAFGGDGRRRSSWSYGAEPMAFVPYPRRARPSLGLRGLSLAPIYRAALADTEAAEAAAIPIEKSDAPILLISGSRDRMWPASQMAGMLVTRLAAAGKRDQVAHLCFDNAGHSFMPWAPNARSTFTGRTINELRLMGFGGLFDLGGRPSANRDALRESWTRVVPFFRENLSRTAHLD